VTTPRLPIILNLDTKNLMLPNASRWISRQILATAVLSAALVAQGAAPAPSGFGPEGKITYKPGAGTTFDGGDTFSLTFLTYAQFQFTDSFGSDIQPPVENADFRIRRLRPSFTGFAFRKELTYTVRLDLTDSTTGTGTVLKDGWAQYDFISGSSDRVGLRMGQSKTYHGLETTETDSALFLVDRSIATSTFSDARSRGAWFHGNHSNFLRWTAGAQNGDVSAANPAQIIEVGEEVDNVDGDLHYVASFNIDPLGDYVGNGKSYESFREGDLANSQELRGTIGAGVMQGRGTPTATPTAPDTESTSINVNTSWKWMGCWAQAEWYWRNDNPATGSDRGGVGGYAELGYVLPKSGDSELQWGLGVRFAEVDFEGGTDGRDYTAVLDMFVRGHALKSQLEYTWRERQVPGVETDSNLIRFQFQLIF
jgi:phosphate-selective porin